MSQKNWTLFHLSITLANSQVSDFNNSFTVADRNYPLTVAHVETPEFIVPDIGYGLHANSPDLSPVDYEIWAVMQRHVYQRDFHSVDELKRGLLVSAVRSRTVNFIARQHTDARYENLYSPHNSDSSSDKIDTKYTTKIIKINLIRT